MLEKLQSLEDKYQELNEQLSQPEIIADQARYQKYAKAHSDLTDIVTAYREYKSVLQQLADTREMLEQDQDEEFRQMLTEELTNLQEQQTSLEHQLRVALLPRDPDDDKSVIMEIRAGTGGEEAALFAGDLFRMYSRYAEEKGWKTDIMDVHYTDIGGIKKSFSWWMDQVSTAS